MPNNAGYDNLNILVVNQERGDGVWNTSSQTKSSESVKPLARLLSALVSYSLGVIAFVLVLGFFTLDAILSTKNFTENRNRVLSR